MRFSFIRMMRVHPAFPNRLPHTSRATAGNALKFHHSPWTPHGAVTLMTCPVIFLRSTSKDRKLPSLRRKQTSCDQSGCSWSKSIIGWLTHTILREHWRPSVFGGPRYWPERLRLMSDFILIGFGPDRRSTTIP